MGGRSRIKRYETRKKIHNLNNRYETRIKGTKLEGMKLEEEVQNFKEKIRKYETKHCFAVLRFHIFFSFVKRSKLSDLFHTASYFAKLEKYLCVITEL